MSASTPVKEEAFEIPVRLKALIFDVDGTLYQQKPVQRAMLKMLLAAALRNPMQGARTLKILASFRKSQEHIRHQSIETEDLALAQLQHAALTSGYDAESVKKCVEQWMETAPLPVLARFLQPGISEFLDEAKIRDIQLAVCSDYPADNKLKAMGMEHYFTTVVYAQNPAIGIFKPHPKGILNALKELGIPAEEALYIGDRADVDAGAAYKAGMHCILVTRKEIAALPPKTAVVKDFIHLKQMLFK